MSRTPILARLLQCFCLCAALQISDARAQAAHDLTDKLNQRVVELFAAEDVVPGMVVAAVKDGQIIYMRGHGFADRESRRPVTPDTAFYIASTTKAFTALAASMLDYRHRLSLDAAFSTYVPGAKFAPPLSASAITLRDLLGMTHGIAQSPDPIAVRTAYTGDFTNEQLVSLLEVYKPAKEGREFLYGNLGYNLAALAMESSQHKGWKELVQQQVFAPLAMRSTTAYVSKVPRDRMALPYRFDATAGLRRIPLAKADGNMQAAGGHFSTGRDLARFLIAQLNEGRVNGRQAIPATVIAQTHVQHVAQNRDFGPFHRHGWSLGFDLGTYSGELLLHRFGTFQGYTSHLSFMPEHGVGVVVLANETSMGTLLSNAVATAIYDELLNKPDSETQASTSVARYLAQLEQGKSQIRRDKERRASRSRPLPLPLSAYVGTFHNDLFGTVRWTQENGGLHAAFGLAESDAEVYDAEHNQLRVELFGGGSVVAFHMENGRSTEIEMLGYKFGRVE